MFVFKKISMKPKTNIIRIWKKYMLSEFLLSHVIILEFTFGTRVYITIKQRIPYDKYNNWGGYLKSVGLNSELINI